jgi:hypothetical protein
MPATKTESSLNVSMVNPTFTQTNFTDAIKTAMNNAGFGAVFDEYTSGTDRYLIYQLVFDANKIYGTVYLVIRVTGALAVTQRLYTNWNKTTRVGDNAGSETSSSGAIFVNNAQVDFVGFARSPEFRLVALYQGTASVFLGYIRPENKPSWWDENAYSYAFVPVSSSNFVQWYGTAMSPYTGSVGTKDRLQAHLSVAQFGTPNPITNKRDILSNILFYAYSNEGIAGRSSSDLVQLASTNLLRKDVIQVTVGAEEYYLLNAVAGGLGVRII